MLWLRNGAVHEGGAGGGHPGGMENHTRTCVQCPAQDGAQNRVPGRHSRNAGWGSRADAAACSAHRSCAAKSLPTPQTSAPTPNYRYQKEKVIKTTNQHSVLLSDKTKGGTHTLMHIDAEYSEGNKAQILRQPGYSSKPRTSVSKPPMRSSHNPILLYSLSVFSSRKPMITQSISITFSCCMNSQHR